MAERDSLDKIVTSYFATLTAQPFEWNGKQYGPRVLHVSPGIVRGFTCPAGCGGCCPRFSLDYIAKDGIPKGHSLKLRKVDFDGRKINVWSDMQKDHESPKCRNLNHDNGRCGIHGFQPFSCDFELLRSLTFDEGNKSVITQKLFGRGWAMMRVDGERGALCEMTTADPDTVADVDRRLARLTTWMTHFGLDPVRVSIIRSRLDEIAATGIGFVIDETPTLF
jgi:hypothetical protein